MLFLEPTPKGCFKDVMDDKYTLSKDGILVNKKTRKVLRGHKNKDGYILDSFLIDGKKIAKRRHRLVYETFIGEIPKGMQVNHKDENKQNNVLSNIDTLMTCKENNNWGTHNERMAKTNKKVQSDRFPNIVQKTLDGEVIKIWPSTMEIQRQLGYAQTNICQCCRGKFKQMYGYKWEYEED